MEIDKEYNPNSIRVNLADTRVNTESPKDIMSVENMEIDNVTIPEKITPIWAQPIFSFLKEGILPSDEVLARQIVRRAKAYTIIKIELYKISVTSVLQRCVDSAEGQEILLDIHQG